jgi:phage tail sheath protein FI
MPEYLSPGVYIEELLGPQPIEGVSTSTTGMVGVTQRGPTTGKPVLVTNFADFRRTFGGFLAEPDEAELAEWELDDQEGGFWWRFPLAVKGYFDNGGRRLFVRRVVSSAATSAEAEIPSSVVQARPAEVRVDPLLLVPPGTAVPARLRAVAKDRGDCGNDITVRMSPMRARRIQAVHASGEGPIATSLAAELAPTATSAVVRWVGRMEGVEGPVVVMIGRDRFRAAAGLVRDGDRATLQLDRPPGTRRGTGTLVKVLRRVSAAAGDGAIRVPLAQTSDEAVYRGALVLVAPDEVRVTVDVVDPPAPGQQGPGTVRLTGATLPDVFESELLELVEARLEVRYEPGAAAGDADRREDREVTEQVLSALRLHPLAGNPRSIVDVVNRESSLVSLEEVPADPAAPAATIGWDLFPGSGDQATGRWIALQDGHDFADQLEPEDFVGEDGGGGRRTGIAALEDIEEISICAVPGIWSRTVQSALIAHCRNLKDRFAILDPPRGLTVQGVQAFREPLSSDYAALYHPWVRVRDPVTREEVPVPPSGHMAGLYAYVDNQRGVHKAPANVVVQQIVNLDDDINQREQDILNPVGINALREFPNRGRLVWGARTLSPIPEWRYVSVRRLFIFIEDSIKHGTQWVVFEPNDEKLWALVRQAITNFLVTVWRSGALQGLKQDEAFYVRCDRSTMSQDDIDNGRLIVEIGIAPARPAEFVIFRFRQKTREQVAVA